MAPNLSSLAGNADADTNLSLDLSLGGIFATSPMMTSPLPQSMMSPVMLPLRRTDSVAIETAERFQLREDSQSSRRTVLEWKRAARSNIMKAKGGVNMVTESVPVMLSIKKIVDPVLVPAGVWPMVVQVNSGPQGSGGGSSGASCSMQKMQGLGAFGLSNFRDVGSPSIQLPSLTSLSTPVFRKSRKPSEREGVGPSSKKVRFQSKQDALTEARRNKATETEPSKNRLAEMQRALTDKMPCVYTKGVGKRVEGYIYRYQRWDVIIVCCCHGQFFTPEAFVKHAAGRDVPNPRSHIYVTRSPLSCYSFNAMAERNPGDL